MGKTSVLDFDEPDVSDVHVPGMTKGTQSSMQRFLAKLKELIKGKVRDGDLSEQDFEECVRQARGHAGGHAKADKMRAAKDAKDVDDDDPYDDEGMPMHEGCKMSRWRLLTELTLSGDGKSGSIQVFPAVGKYSHPRYGELDITPEFLRRVKANFDGKVYQQELPLTIDLEHQSKLSGAAGWIASLDLRGKDGLWATVEFNDRGQALVADDAYRYFSPEFYDDWMDPATSKGYKDVLIGGALTNRPFFKGMQPVVMASEQGHCFCMMPDMTSHADMKMQKADARVNYREANDPAESCPMCRFCCPDASCCLVEGKCEMDCCCDLWTEKASAMGESIAKSEGDAGAFPASDYAYVPDAQKPSTWKLRLAKTPGGGPDAGIVGAAIAALGKGFRGNKVEIPAADLPAVKARVRAAWKKANPGKSEDDLPEALQASLIGLGWNADEASTLCAEIGLVSNNAGGESMGMSDEEARQFAEMRDTLKSLGERLATETEARKAAEAEAKTARESVQALERERKRDGLRQFVESNRMAFATEMDKAVDRLEALANKLSAEEFDDYLAERRTTHMQLKESAAFTQIGGVAAGGNGGVTSEIEGLVQKAMAAQPVLSRAEAYGKVLSENPALYQRYDKEQQRIHRRGGD